MPVTEIGDPRLQALFGAEDPRADGVRPTVRLPGSGLSPLVIALLIGLAAVVLFTVLNARRTGQSEPPASGRASGAAGTAWEAPPPLYIPPAPVPLVVQPVTAPRQVTPAPAPAPAPVAAARPVVTAPQIVYTPPPMPQAAPMTGPATAPRAPSGPALVIDAGNASSAANVPPAAVGALPGDAAGGPAARMRASTLANRSMTVPQGYLIPAVLETGFDSTRAGYARAVVSRDVRGFDGRNILIPRGSRLIGAYRSEVAKGQKRATITWTRLIRPDGMTIAMDAPLVDTVGRGGIPARVNSHFFSRLGDALLQTTVDLGRAFAGRSVTGPVVVVSGNATSAASQLTTGRTYEPTLSVAPGTSISVFVAHDLDFTAAGTGR